eukprot:6787205-Pyramimonas_sp.AAC.1
MARSTLTRQEPLPSRTARVLSNDPTCGLGGDAAHLRSANHIETRSGPAPDPLRTPSGPPLDPL